MMEHRLIVLVARYGSVTVFFAQVFGIFGLPIPDEFMLTVAGALARAGRLNLTTLLLAAVSGCLCGITLSYVLGRTVGATAVHRLVHVSDAAIERGQRWFHRFGGWLLMFGYFVPGVRHVTAIAAGSAPIGYGEFARFAYPGGVLWSVSFVTLGYYAGSRWRSVAAFGRTWLPAIAIAVATVVTLVVYIIHQRRSKAF